MTLEKSQICCNECASKVWFEYDPILESPLVSNRSNADPKRVLENTYLHYNKFDFFQGSKPLKKVLKNLEKNYFKSPIDP